MTEPFPNLQGAGGLAMLDLGLEQEWSEPPAPSAGIWLPSRDFKYDVLDCFLCLFQPKEMEWTLASDTGAEPLRNVQGW